MSEYSSYGLIEEMDCGATLWKYNGYHHNRRTVLVSTPTERPGASDVIGDIVWRRTHNAPYPPSVVAKAVEMKTGFGTDGGQYSRKCYCTMCPCSPGFKIRLKSVSYAGQAVSIDLTAEELEEAARSM